MPYEHLLSYEIVQQIAVQSTHLCQSNSHPLRPRRVTWAKTKRDEGVKSGCSGALIPSKLGLSCKANEYSDYSTMLVMSAQPAPGEFSNKTKARRV